jgi:STE24 endopeptidase
MTQAMTQPRWIPALLLCALLCLPAVAQPPDASGTDEAAQAPAAQSEPAPAATPAVAREPFDAKAATEAYLARLTPEERERSDSYFEGGYWLQLWNFLFGLAVAWLLLGTRLSAKMRDLAQKVTRFRAVHVALYAVQYLLLTAVIGFPLTVYQGYFREHQYGLANQGFGGWLGEQLTGLMVTLILLPILLVILYAVFRRAPRTWWLWGSAVSLGFLVLMLLIGPVYIAPLFNDYQPLDDPATVEPILSMARANGVAVDNVYEFDASRQSKRVSANVSGIFGTMRISLNDNLLERCDLAGVKAVMAHELGHYVLNHVYETVVFFIVVLVAGFGFVRFTFDRAVARWGGKWGVSGIGDIAGLPLLGALLAIYFFCLTPILNTYIRTNEAEADIFGLNVAREPEGFAEVSLMLSEYRKLDPGPIEEWIFYDHPSGRARIAMAMQWKAENLEEE